MFVYALHDAFIAFYASQHPDIGVGMLYGKTGMTVTKINGQDAVSFVAVSCRGLA
jgi:hypothetical protein